MPLYDQCWDATGQKGITYTEGYAYKWDPEQKKRRRIHRFMWEVLFGEVPPELDHSCFNKACYNPTHIEEVTHTENIQRRRPGWKKQPKSHCPRGHLFEGNTYTTPDGRRQCKTCRTARTRR